MTRWARYRDAALTDDLIAALIVAILLVPQSLAYALLAGLPPVVGVMASLLPIIAYAAFGSSSTLAVGPVAVLAMMTAQVVEPVAQIAGVAAPLVAMVLAAEMAAVLLLAALLRLEMLAALLSAPVLHGFIAGASLMIALGQVPQLLGLPVRGSTALDMWASWQQLPGLWPHAATTGIGLVALAALWGMRRHGGAVLARLGFQPRAAQLLARTAPIVVVISAIVWIAAFPQWSQGVGLSGRIRLGDGLEFVMVWHAPWTVWQALLAPAILLALVAYVESLAVAEALAARRGEKISPRKELLGLAPPMRRLA